MRDSVRFCEELNPREKNQKTTEKNRAEEGGESPTEGETALTSRGQRIGILEIWPYVDIKTLRLIKVRLLPEVSDFANPKTN